MNSKRKVERHARGGFTLVELLLVVTILGVLATIVVVGLGGQSERARIEATRASINGIGTAVGIFDATKSRLPESLDELCTGDDNTAPLLNKANLNDSWGHAFHYKKTTRRNYEVRSDGPDGNAGTEDDITN
ncbi:MAG: type II secretion system protein GspG [bacterium]